MGWFDEQIKQRKLTDDQVFQESIDMLASAVMGKEVKNDLDAFAHEDAINMILKYYGYKPKPFLKDVDDVNEQLEHICRPYGIMRRDIVLTEGWYKDAFGAILAYFKEDNTPVALIPANTHGYVYIQNGKKHSINAKTAKLFKRDALCFYKPLPLKKLNPIDLIKYAFETRSPSDIAQILIMMGITTLVGLLVPKISYFLMGTVVEQGSPSLLIGTLVFLFFTQIGSSLFTVVNGAINSKVNEKMSICVQAATMMRVLSLPASFFKNYSSGELSSRITYVSSLANTLMTTIFSTGLSSLFSLAYIASIFEFAPSLVVPALIIIFASIASSVISTFVQMNLTRKQMEYSSKESGMSFSLISGIQKIKTTGSEKRAFARWGKIFAKQSEVMYKPIYITIVSSVISTIGTIVMYYVAVKSNIDVAGYYAFNTAYGMVSGAFASLSSIAITFANIKPTLEMSKPILEAVPEISEGKEVLSHIQGGIELNDVCFKYDEGMPNVIDHLSLKINPGQYVAVVGKTGCGKSTLVRLILGFEKPQKGSIFFDSKDINSIDLKSLRRKIGTVMQNGSLFQGDIYSNIVISAPWLNIDEAWKAAEIAGIAEDIKAMPMGMFTLISEGSGGISGGQKQRLMIARAIAPKPRILIFDEATSALDNITQKKVSESLDSLKCTRIVIAHRLSTIKHCDRILFFENGKIVEDGTYDELIKLNGKFAELVERQRLDVPSKED